MNLKFFRCVLRKDPTWIVYAAAFTKSDARLVIQDCVRDGREGGICGIIPPLEEIEMRFERTRLSPVEWKRVVPYNQAAYESRVHKLSLRKLAKMGKKEV